MFCFQKPCLKSLILGTLCASVLFAQAPQPAPAGDIVGVGNFSHIVQNMERSVEFYRDVLGLEEGKGQPFGPNEAIAKLGNTMGGQSRFTPMKVPGAQIGVELIEYKDIDRKPASPRFQDPGAANLALRARDVDGIFSRFEKFQAKYKAGRVISAGGKPATINANGNMSHVMFMQDPDGFVVEIGQGTPPADSKVAANSNIFGGSFELAIADTDQSVKFYDELLGFHMKKGAEFNANAAMAATAGVPGAQFRQSRSLIPGTSANMTLIEFKGVDRKPLTGRIQDPGTAILQLRVADATALTAKLKAAGVPVTTVGGEPVQIGAGAKISIVRDPNNLYLELIQAAPRP